MKIDNIIQNLINSEAIKQFLLEYQAANQLSNNQLSEFCQKERAWILAKVYGFNESATESITVQLPDGRSLTAYDKQDPGYPGIKIVLKDADGTEDIIAWAEYNEERSDYLPNQRLRLILWNANNDEPAVNMSYNTDEFETDN